MLLRSIVSCSSHTRNTRPMFPFDLLDKHFKTFYCADVSHLHHEGPNIVVLANRVFSDSPAWAPARSDHFHYFHVRERRSQRVCQQPSALHYQRMKISVSISSPLRCLPSLIRARCSCTSPRNVSTIHPDANVAWILKDGDASASDSTINNYWNLK